MENTEFLDLINRSKKHKNILEELKNSKLPVVVWGCGSLSYSIRKILKKII